MSHSPLNLCARDFDAYAPEKATSNAYARPRLEVKQRALGWARGVVARLAELGIAVDVHGSDEHLSLRNKKRVDCQWVFFWRDAAAREELSRLLEQGRTISQEIDDPSPYTRHAFLALRVDVKSIEVCFAVHPEARVDVDNLHARLGADAPSAALKSDLMSALAALPEEFMIGVGDDRVACASATSEAILSMLDRAAAGQVPLWIGWSVSRETALLHAATLDEQLEDAIIALAPIYKLVAWSRDNDRVALDRRLEGVEKERARTHAEAEAQTARWREEQDLARRRSQEQAKERGDPTRRATPGAPLRRPVSTLSAAPTAAPTAAPKPGRRREKTPPLAAPRRAPPSPRRRASPRAEARSRRAPASASAPGRSPIRSASSASSTAEAPRACSSACSPPGSTSPISSPRWRARSAPPSRAPTAARSRPRPEKPPDGQRRILSPSPPDPALPPR